MQQGCAFWCLADAPRGSISQPALLNSSVVLGLAHELEPEFLDGLLKEPRGGDDECRLAPGNHRVVHVQGGEDVHPGVPGVVRPDREERDDRDHGHDGGEEPPLSIDDDREKTEHEGLRGLGRETRGTTSHNHHSRKTPFCQCKRALFLANIRQLCCL